VPRRRGLSSKRRSFAAAKPGGKTQPVIGWDPIHKVFRPAVQLVDGPTQPQALHRVDPLLEWRKAQRNKRPV
jgi:hypothetical protein